MWENTHFGQMLEVGVLKSMFSLSFMDEDSNKPLEL